VLPTLAQETRLYLHGEQATTAYMTFSGTSLLNLAQMILVAQRAHPAIEQKTFSVLTGSLGYLVLGEPYGRWVQSLRE
jgi:hypothetical protein